jgi:uncharacterized protein (TIGR02147 family)
MLSPLSFENYKEFLVKLIDEDSKERGFQSQMAKAMNCQAAYLSQVLRGKVELTEDHGLKLTQFLKLNSYEADYFLILLRHSRAATPELRTYLENKREELKLQNAEMKNKVGAKSARDSEAFLSKYFSSAIPSTIHIATSSKNYQTVESLAERFSLSKENVEEILAFLEKYKLVKKENNRFVFSGESVHLPKSSDLHRPYQSSYRVKAIRSIEEKSEDDLHFSSVFTIDKKHYKDVLEVMKKAIEDSHKIIHSSGTEEVYTLVMDFFHSN